MHTSLKAALCGAIVLTCTGLTPAAAILTTANGMGADAGVSNDSNQSATSTHGTEGSAAIRNFAATRAKAGYFRFDLTGVTGDLSGATLTVTFSGANRARTMNVYGLTDESLDSWSEAAIAYANAPGILQPDAGGAAYNSGDLSVDPAKLTLLTSFTTPASAPNSATTSVDIDLDNLLAADTNDLVTLVLYTSATDNNASYFVATKENTGALAFPTLTLPNAVIPEPASLSLLGLGAAGLLRRRK